MKRILYRYKLLMIVILINIILHFISPHIATTAMIGAITNLKEMLFIMPPIFILLGFLDVWVDKNIMVKFMGKNSGIRGVLTAFFIGSVAAGPGYMAFPFTEVLIKKGSKFTNIIIFIGAWSATKIPISLFEASIMGWKFMLLRYALDVPAILIMAKCIDIFLSKKDKELIYAKNALKSEY